MNNRPPCDPCGSRDPNDRNRNNVPRGFPPRGNRSGRTEMARILSALEHDARDIEGVPYPESHLQNRYLGFLDPQGQYSTQIPFAEEVERMSQRMNLVARPPFQYPQQTTGRTLRPPDRPQNRGVQPVPSAQQLRPGRISQGDYAQFRRGCRFASTPTPTPVPGPSRQPCPKPSERPCVPPMRTPPEARAPSRHDLSRPPSRNSPSYHAGICVPPMRTPPDARAPSRHDLIRPPSPNYPPYNGPCVPPMRTPPGARAPSRHDLIRTPPVNPPAPPYQVKPPVYMEFSPPRAPQIKPPVYMEFSPPPRVPQVRRPVYMEFSPPRHSPLVNYMENSPPTTRRALLPAEEYGCPAGPTKFTKGASESVLEEQQGYQYEEGAPSCAQSGDWESPMPAGNMQYQNARNQPFAIYEDSNQGTPAQRCIATCSMQNQNARNQPFAIYEDSNQDTPVQRGIATCNMQYQNARNQPFAIYEDSYQDTPPQRGMGIREVEDSGEISAIIPCQEDCANECSGFLHDSSVFSTPRARR